jgi:phosphoribosylformimino-5-aminoimidazole carboxamide ribotide isomerase
MSESEFDIIPVIDLRKGEVVRAKAGLRHLYAPIETPLAATSKPADVVEGLLRLHPFETIYVADLDAIEGSGDHAQCLAELAQQFAKTRFWVDPGISRGDDAEAWLQVHRADLVLGSESLDDVEALAALRDNARILLSLDFRGEVRQGLAQIFDDKTLWPHRVIAMTLARVGSHAGPDLDRLGAILSTAQKHHAIYAAGGVRNRADLDRLRQIGTAGVLIASALHDGNVTAEDLRAFNKKGSS